MYYQTFAYKKFLNHIIYMLASTWIVINFFLVENLNPISFLFSFVLDYGNYQA